MKRQDGMKNELQDSEYETVVHLTKISLTLHTTQPNALLWISAGVVILIII